MCTHLTTVFKYLVCSDLQVDDESDELPDIQPPKRRRSVITIHAPEPFP